MSTSTLKLGGVHLAAVGLLLWLGYEWLGLADSTGFRLVLSALDAAAILALTCWLYGATLVYFRSGSGKLNESFRTALRHLAPLAAAAIVVIGIYGLSTANFLGQPAFDTASFLTLRLHRSVKPAAVLNVFRTVLWIARWVVLPVALLPVASGIAMQGWRGVREFTWRANWRYWIGVPVLLVIGVILPGLMLGWRPRGSFVVELVSFALRVLVAYLLLVGGLLGLCAVTAQPPWRRVDAKCSTLMRDTRARSL
jgi:hypothetical protein